MFANDVQELQCKLNTLTIHLKDSEMQDCALDTTQSLEHNLRAQKVGDKSFRSDDLKLGARGPLQVLGHRSRSGRNDVRKD